MIKFINNGSLYGNFYIDKEGTPWGNGTTESAIAHRISINANDIELELENMGCKGVAKCVRLYDKIKEMEKNLDFLIITEFEKPLESPLGCPWSKLKFITNQIEEVAEQLD